MRKMLALWTGVIVAVVVPWNGFQDHAHWNQIRWVPFGDSSINSRDVVLNIVLYMPWGYLHARTNPERIWRTIGLSSMLALGTEAAQVFSHGRFPSMTDVACNIAGACVSAAAFGKFPWLTLPILLMDRDTQRRHHGHAAGGEHVTPRVAADVTNQSSKPHP